MRGTVTRMVRERGFGFIKDDGGGEYFFHRTAVVDNRFDEMREGKTIVEFDEEKHDKGPRAQHVEIIAR